MATFDLPIPAGGRFVDPVQGGLLAKTLIPPLVLKGEGLAHKSESGAVKLKLSRDDIPLAIEKMDADSFLLEEMIAGSIVELLVGVVRDPAHGFVLTIGAGGVLTELLKDTVSLLLPIGNTDVLPALKRLKIWKIIEGYRGQNGADINAIIHAVLAIQSYVLANSDIVEEVEINPLICTSNNAIAVDALIRKTQ